MEYVLIIHEIEDYAAWKKTFDEADPIRKDAGERSYQVLRLDDDPNRIVHFSRWRSLESARAFFESPKLVEIRGGGVKALEIKYLKQLEEGVLDHNEAINTDA